MVWGFLWLFCFVLNLFCWSSLLYPSLIFSEPEKKQTLKDTENRVLYKLREELRGGGAKVGGTELISVMTALEEEGSLERERERERP